MYMITHITMQEETKESTSNDCPICFQALVEEASYTTPCNHKFCKSCIGRLTRTFCSTNSLSCPMCRAPFDIPLHDWEQESLDVVYNYFKAMISSEDSMRLLLTEEYVGIVKFILTSKYSRQLIERIQNDQEEAKYFRMIYDDFRRGKHHFVKIRDKYNNFALAWLYYKYH
jgi:Ring finger domain